MISLQTNVNALVAQQNLNVNDQFQSKTIEQLTSGYRINNAGDDAAGLAVANQMQSTISELTQGVANGNDATAQLQIMDGGMSNISTILDRLKTLATQSASGTMDNATRVTLNSEFQTDIGEIDRQAQSIGLNTGGTFAQNLSIYLGQGSGSQSLANGTVTLNLSQAITDSQSLGLKGMQATVGTADIGDTSNTSVANILANSTNAASEAVPGTTVFNFSGPGFSSLQVAVNTSGVSGIDSLVQNINAAIQNASAGGTSAAAAFKSAGVVASVNTDANGGEQLAFTSSTAAFQVSAGDQMANALMGNFSSGTTGDSLATTVTGQATKIGALAANHTINVEVKGSGGLDQTISLATNTYATGAAAIADLMNEINKGKTTGGATSAAGQALSAAGISVALGGVNNNQLVFTNSANSQFQVLVSGDTANALGLGSSLAGAANAVTYSTITAANNYDANGSANNTVQNAGAQTSLEFSIAGGPAVGLAPIALDGGDATGGTNTGAAIGSNGVVVTGNTDNTLTFSLDGQAVTTTLLATANKGDALFTGSTLGGPPATTAYGSDYAVGAATTTGNVSMAGGDALLAGETFTLAFDGGSAKTITLAGTGTDVPTTLADINSAIKTAFGGQQVITASASGNDIVLTATNNGPASTFTLAEGTGALAGLGLSANTYSGPGGNSGNNSFLMSVNGSAMQTITLAGNDTHVSNLVQDLNNQLLAAFGNGANAVTAAADAVTGAITFTTATGGLDSSIQLAAATNASTGLTDTTLADMGFTAGIQNGTGYTATDIAGYMNTAIADAQMATDPTTHVTGTLYQANTDGGNLGAKVTAVGGALVITNSVAGADHTISEVTGGAAANAGFAAGGTLSNNGLDATNAHGTNRSITSLVAAIKGEIGNNATLTAAGLEAVNSAGKLQIDSTNGTKFQLNVGAASANATTTGTADLTSGANFTPSPVTLQLSTDGGTTTTTVTLNQNETTASAVLGAINGQLTTSGATAKLLSVNGKNYLQLEDNTGGPTNELQISGTGLGTLGLTAGTYTGANEVDLGFGSVSNQSFTGNQGIAEGLSSLTGVSASGSAQTGGISFSAIAQGGGTQALTFSANNSNGDMQSTAITLAATGSGTAALANDGTASSIGSAVAFINQQLQKTNNPTLQGIVAVEQNVNGNPEINFISQLSNFQVSVGSGPGGLNGGTAETTNGNVVGAASTVSIATQEGAQTAITAITNAVDKLGSVQAVVGIGENQLNFAVSLAQSQITNFSAAESQIKDANVAQEAANLTKAQVLQQASIAAMAQANSAPQAILKLLA